MSESFEAQVTYWRHTVNAQPGMLDQVIRSMLLARQTQTKAESESARAQAIINDLELKAMSSNQRLAELEGVLEAVPVAALQAIEEIAPLIARDKLSSPEAWMKAWEEVSPWLASLRALRVSPETPWHLGEIG